MKTQPKADWTVSSFPGKIISVDKLTEHHSRGGTIGGKEELGMATIFGPGGPIMVLWTVQRTTFEGGPSMT